MIKTEKAHKIHVKEPYNTSSKAPKKIQSEVAKRVQDQRLFMNTVTDYREIMNKRKINYDKELQLREHNLTYVTESDIRYNCFKGKNNIQQLCFANNNWSCVNNWNFMNPAISVLHFNGVLHNLNIFLNDDELNRLKSKTPGYLISMVSHYEVVSEAQGIPNFKLYCSRIVNASSTEESQGYKRFDWIVSLDENGKQ